MDIKVNVGRLRIKDIKLGDLGRITGYGPIIIVIL